MLFALIGLYWIGLTMLLLSVLAVVKPFWILQTSRRRIFAMFAGIVLMLPGCVALSAPPENMQEIVDHIRREQDERLNDKFSDPHNNQVGRSDE